MTRIADTSFLYAAFDEADARHKTTRDELAKPQAVAIPLCVLAEFLDLVEYRHDRSTAMQVHEDLEKLATVSIAEFDDEPAVVALWAQHPKLSMADAAGVQACLENNATLLSYDTDQLAALETMRTGKPSKTKAA